MSTESANPWITAIVIDDDDAHRDLIRRSLEVAADADHVFSVNTYAHADEALADLPPGGRVVILCDYRLAGTSGLDWLPDFIRADVGPVIIVTSSGDERIAAEAFRHGAADYIKKSTLFENPDRLRRAISEALRRFKLEHTNRDLARKLKLANGELRKKNVVLAELTDTAHRFVDDVAHEFRTPLAVIKEFASIMADGIGGDINERQAEYLRFISDASRDLSHLIDDFLDSGKLRARTLRVDRREHSVSELIDSSWPMIESRAATKRIVLERAIASDLPPVFCDADKVRRTLTNLVVNAIKFSDTDSVVTVSAVAREDGSVSLSVTDRGPGLPEDEVERLFERFRQGGEANRISTKGFGLGLNIVKELVAINLGTASVISDLGRGSTFSFTLPGRGVENIVGAFIDRTAERSSAATLAVLCARRPASADSVEELRSFLGSVCHATDIQLAGPDGRSVIIVGETLEPDGWRDRLIRQDEENRAHTPAGDFGPLCVEHLGSWHVREARDALLFIVCPPREARCCA